MQNTLAASLDTLQYYTLQACTVPPDKNAETAVPDHLMPTGLGKDDFQCKRKTSKIVWKIVQIIFYDLEFHELFSPLSQFGNCFVAIYIHAYTVNAMLCHQKIRKEHP